MVWTTTINHKSTVNISAFGGIKNKSFLFEDGFNVIFGENENGKSTVMAFIKMMFYGTGGKRASSLSKNLRKKYKPWDGKSMILIFKDGHKEDYATVSYSTEGGYYFIKDNARTAHT